MKGALVENIWTKFGDICEDKHLVSDRNKTDGD